MTFPLRKKTFEEERLEWERKQRFDNRLAELLMEYGDEPTIENYLAAMKQVNDELNPDAAELVYVLDEDEDSS